MVMVALGLILFASVAWLVSNRQNSGIADDLKVVDIDSTSIRLFHIITDDNGNVLIGSDGKIVEEQMDRILIQNFVPNQSEKYRLEIQNNSTSEKKISLTFSNINADFEPPNTAINPDMKLADKIIMSGLFADAELNATLNANINGINSMTNLIALEGQIPAGEKNKIKLAENITLGGEKTGSIYFTFTLSKEAHNEYQQMAIQVEKVQLATQQK